MSKISGVRLFGDLSLSKNFQYQDEHAYYKEKIDQIVDKAGFTITDTSYHRFDDGSFSYGVMLCESHVVVHTWPRDGFFTLDLHVCNYSRDNRAAARRAAGEIAKLLGWNGDKLELIEYPFSS
jgi:S-adenosylmethionine/arginine decarboxylase-like enzyme